MALRFPFFSPAPAGRITALALLCVLLAVSCLTGCGPDRTHRAESLRALARWEDQRLAPQDSLTALLNDADAHVRLAAVRSAGLIGRSGVLPAMANLLADRSTTVACQAAFSLGLLGDDDAVDDLAQAARGPRPALRVAALQGLAHLQHDGAAFLAAAAAEDPAEAAAAWDGLRNVAAQADSAALRQALLAGLERQESDIIWRVLRCCEVTPWPALTAAVAPHARSVQPQVRVHAYRALARLGTEEALTAVVAAGRAADRFRDHHRDRVEIALLRALGALATHDFRREEKSGDPREFLTASLIEGAGSANPHVALTALAAMESAVDELPLPREAARQESLLPVWRIRLARAARSHLDHPTPQVRAAAVRAWARLRGEGSGPELARILAEDQDPQVAVACLFAISRVHPAPLLLLNPFTAPTGDARQSSALKVAALEGTAHVFQNRPDTLPANLTRSFVLDRLTAAAADPDFVVAATGADLLGQFPHRLGLTALVELWDRAAGAEKADLQLAVLSALQGMGEAVAKLERPDSTGTATDPLLDITREVLRSSFDSPDLRVRYQGREAALATDLLPARLIPSRASLLATLPAFTRSSQQAPLALPFDAPKVRCLTDKGEFIIELDGRTAPNTCAVFLDLIGQGFYDDLDFHRVVPDFVVQGGCPRGDGWGGPGFTIRSEWSRRPFTRGVVGIAHSGKDSGGSQFFVTLSEQPHLNGRYTVFGEVTKGMDVVARLTVGDRFQLVVVP